MIDALFFILIVALILGAAFWGLREFRKLQRKTKEQQNADAKKDIVHEIKGLILIPIAKYAWNGRNAPDGTFSKIVWQVFLIVLITVIFWFVLGLIDRRINGPDLQTPNVETRV